MTPSNRQRLGRNEARDIILLAAARVFNTKGRGLTVEDIAREADYSTSALYKHFSNKQDILRTLWERVSQRMLELFQDEPPVELAFVERLKWTLHRMAKLAEEEREMFLAGMANVPAPVHEPINQLDEDLVCYHKSMRQEMISLMERGIADDVLVARDPQTYATALGGHLKALIVQWAFLGPFPLKPRIDDALEVFLMGAFDDQARNDYLER